MDAAPRTANPWLALAAAVLITGTFGSIHAFSVFVAPLETLLEIPRADVSLLYSGALAALTVAVLLGHRVYRRLPPAAFAACFGVAAALGLALAGWGLTAEQDGTLWSLAIGYSLMFGAANGLAYGFCLFLAGGAMGPRRGFAIGAVTAAYALGATASAKFFADLIAWEGPHAALLTLAAALLAVTGLAAVLFHTSRVRTPGSESDSNRIGIGSGGRAMLLLWIGYGLGAAAGLMAMGHAAGIVAAAGGSAAATVLGAVLIGAGNTLGGLAAGWLADTWPPHRQLIGLPIVSLLALLALAAVGTPGLAIVGLAVVGFAYGALIVAYPAAIVDAFGPEDSARVYGRVFTAWGLAGLGAPWLAGAFYDTSGSYRLALVLAAGAALVSAAAAFRVPQRGTEFDRA